MEEVQSFEPRLGVQQEGGRRWTTPDVVCLGPHLWQGPGELHSQVQEDAGCDVN